MKLRLCPSSRYLGGRKSSVIYILDTPCGLSATHCKVACSKERRRLLNVSFLCSTFCKVGCLAMLQPFTMECSEWRPKACVCLWQRVLCDSGR